MTRLKYKIENYDTREIDTKFGKIYVDESNSICFPRGIVGFGSIHHYFLTPVPENKLPGALILQSLEDEKLAFITLPLAEKFYKGDSALIKYEDVISASESYEIKEENLVLIVISKLVRLEDKLSIMINLKAPIFIDSHEKIAYQHVFIKNDYPLSYLLS